MILRTRAELIARVARKLKLTGLGDSVAAEEAAVIRDEYSDKLEEWRERGLIYWTNTNDATAEIPAVVFPTMVLLMANAVAAEFGKGPGGVDQVATEDVLLTALRRLVARESAGETTSFTDY